MAAVNTPANQHDDDHPDSQPPLEELSALVSSAIFKTYKGWFNHLQRRYHHYYVPLHAGAATYTAQLRKLFLAEYGGLQYVRLYEVLQVLAYCLRLTLQ